jgi:molybdate transport system substrate-binding protein
MRYRIKSAILSLRAGGILYRLAQVARSLLMKPKKVAGLAAMAALLTLSGCVEGQQSDAGGQVITVHAAISLSELLKELGSQYGDTHGLEFRYNFASSGALGRQLIAAPRGDLYFSANPDWMQRVKEAQVVEAGSVSSLFANRLALVAHRDNPIPSVEDERLCELPIKRLSIGDPDYVPAGQYARAWLRGIDCDGASAWEIFEDRVLPGNDVHAALARVQNSREIVGVVYMTDYLAKAESLRLLYAVPEKAAPPILYLGAIVRGSAQADAAAAFLEYLRSKDAREIVLRHGFSIPEVASDGYLRE